MATFWFISVTLTTAHFHHSALLDSSFCKTATPGAASLPTPGASLSSSCHSCCTWTSWGVVIGTSPRGPAQGLVIAGHQGLLKELLGGNFFFFSFFHVKERERWYDPLIHEHNPNKRNSPNSDPYQQIHRGVSEHRGCLRGRELPRGEPRLEA